MRRIHVIFQPLLLFSLSFMATVVSGLIIPVQTLRKELIYRQQCSRPSSSPSSLAAHTNFNYERRKFLAGMFSTPFSFLLINPASSNASQVRPTSKELLRPPIRVKLFIDKATDMCQTIVDNQNNDNNISNTKENLRQLQQFILSEPKTFMTADEIKKSKLYLEIDTTTPWQQARLKERVERGRENGIDYTTPYDKINTAIQQWGDRRQFEILQNRQLQLEKASAIRSAFNGYTSNLVFSSNYQLNVQGYERSQMIRNNALPDPNTVVVSDLDLRDLYRNQILQYLDDVKAEIKYQLQQQQNGNNETIDAKEVLILLQSAQSSCNEWFSFIPSEDIEEAMQDVMATANGEEYWLPPN